MRVVELVYAASCFVQFPEDSTHIALLMADGHIMLCDEQAFVGKPVYAIKENTRPEYLVCMDCLEHMDSHIGVIREATKDD